MEKKPRYVGTWKQAGCYLEKGINVQAKCASCLETWLMYFKSKKLARETFSNWVPCDKCKQLGKYVEVEKGPLDVKEETDSLF